MGVGEVKSLKDGLNVLRLVQNVGWLTLEVKLSNKVLNHIVVRHPEVAAYTHEIIETVENPDLIIKGLRGELKALKFYTELHIGSKYLVVVYRERGKAKVIITAYFTSNVDKVKGEVVWRKPQ